MFETCISLKYARSYVHVYTNKLVKAFGSKVIIREIVGQKGEESGEKEYGLSS